MKFSSLNAHICSFRLLVIKGCKTTCIELKAVNSAEMKGE